MAGLDSIPDIIRAAGLVATGNVACVFQETSDAG
jgi:hypothetical protein